MHGFFVWEEIFLAWQGGLGEFERGVPVRDSAGESLMKSLTRGEAVGDVRSLATYMFHYKIICIGEVLVLTSTMTGSAIVDHFVKRLISLHGV